MTDRAESPSRRIYPRPPIIEAVIELRFASPAPADSLYAALRASLGGQFPKARRIDTVEVRTELGETGGVARASRRPRFRCLASEDGLRLIGCGPEALTIHVLAPYPGWENFRDQAARAAAAVGAGHGSLEIAEVVVRYIDRIELPARDPRQLEEYLTMLPSRPAALPAGTAAFSWRLDGVDVTTRTRTRLEVDFSAGIDGEPHVLFYDLTALRALAAPVRLDSDVWWDVVEALHLVQRTTFEQSITDPMRALFE